MLSKEECEQVLMNICSSNSRIEDRKVFKDLINEHFELVEEYRKLKIALDNAIKQCCIGVTGYVEKIVRDILNGEMKLENFVEEHFELVEKYEMLDNTYSMICEDYLNPQPYKFEDLQTEMQVYDNYLKECIEISVMCGRNIANHTVTFFRWGQEELEVVKFEDNRFYPVHIAKRGVSDV